MCPWGRSTRCTCLVPVMILGSAKLMRTGRRFQRMVMGRSLREDTAAIFGVVTRSKESRMSLRLWALGEARGLSRMIDRSNGTLKVESLFPTCCGHGLENKNGLVPDLVCVPFVSVNLEGEALVQVTRLLLIEVRPLSLVLDRLSQTIFPERRLNVAERPIESCPEPTPHDHPTIISWGQWDEIHCLGRTVTNVI